MAILVDAFEEKLGNVKKLRNINIRYLAKYQRKEISVQG